MVVFCRPVCTPNLTAPDPSEPSGRRRPGRSQRSPYSGPVLDVEQWPDAPRPGDARRRSPAGSTAASRAPARWPRSPTALESPRTVRARSTSPTSLDLQQTRPTVTLVDGVTRRIDVAVDRPRRRRRRPRRGRRHRARAVGALAGRHRRARRRSRARLDVRLGGHARRDAGAGVAPPAGRRARHRVEPLGGAGDRRAAGRLRRADRRPDACCRSRSARPGSARSGCGPRCRTTSRHAVAAGDPGAARAPARASPGSTVDLHALDEQIDAYLERVEEGLSERPDVADLVRQLEAAGGDEESVVRRGPRPRDRAVPARRGMIPAGPAEEQENAVSVVKINAITVPAERADELVARFAARAGEVGGMDGFEAFELLRPNDDRDTVPRVHAVALRGGLPGLGAEPGVPARPPGAQHATARSAPTPSCGASTSCSTRTRPRTRDAAVTDARAELTGPGGPFEIVTEDVLGVPLQVYKPAAALDARPRRRAPTPAATSTGSCRATAASPTASTTRSVRRAAAALLDLGVEPRRPGRGPLGQHHRVGRDVLGLRGASARRACRSTRGGRRRSWSSRCATPAPRCCSATRSAGRSSATSSADSTTLEHVFVIGPRRARRPRPARRWTLLEPADPGALPDVAGRRGRPARDPLHVGHHREAEGRDDHPPPGARQPAEPRAASAAIAAAQGAAESAHRHPGRRTCSSCRCST